MIKNMSFSIGKTSGTIYSLSSFLLFIKIHVMHHSHQLLQPRIHESKAPNQMLRFLILQTHFFSLAL